MSSSDWGVVVSEFKVSLKAVLERDGVVTDSIWSAAPASVPALVTISGSKQKERVYLHVWMFPVKDGKVAVSYAQEYIAQ
jgi:hypothetical protein